MGRGFGDLEMGVEKKIYSNQVQNGNAQ